MAASWETSAPSGRSAVRRGPVGCTLLFSPVCPVSPPPPRPPVSCMWCPCVSTTLDCSGGAGLSSQKPVIQL